STPLKELRSRAEALAARLRDIPGLDAKPRDSTAFVGGGSLPEQELKTVVVALSAGIGDERLAERLRTGDPAVLPRVQAGRVLLDVRTVLPGQEDALVEAVRQAVAG